MEVEVLGVDGIAQDAVISIRAGATRRQAAVSAFGSPKIVYFHMVDFEIWGGPINVVLKVLLKKSRSDGDPIQKNWIDVYQNVLN